MDCLAQMLLRETLPLPAALAPPPLLSVSDTSFLWSEPRFPFSGSLNLLGYTSVPTSPLPSIIGSGLVGQTQHPR